MRARNIKPDFFRDAELLEVSIEARFLFIGLWCLADREGKLKDKPKQIRVEVFPETQTRNNIEFLLNTLVDHDLIIRYEIDNHKYIKVVNFLKHQSPHHTEKQSEIPDPRVSHGEPTVNHGESPEISSDIALIPDSLNPDLLNTDKNTLSDSHKSDGAYSQEFLELWKIYPNHQGSKKDAFTAFKKVKSKLPADIQEIIKRQKDEKAKADKLSIFMPEFKHFHRWLNKQMWELEPFDFNSATPREEQPQWVRDLKAQSTR